jgi:hypothetical protein
VGVVEIVPNINAYLRNAPNILVGNRTKPLCNAPSIVTGNQATDGGNFYFTPEEYKTLIAQYPKAQQYLRKAYNSQDFLAGKYQYCLWLVDVSPADLRQIPAIMERIKKVREYRLSRNKVATRKQAEIPTLFTEIRQPKGHYIVIPKVSSENRAYIPLGFLGAEIICNNTIKFIPDATAYHFGVLSSNVHNSWMRAIAGRMKSDYQYSNNIVYNNFPWPTPTDKQRAQIEQTAQAILDARAKYPDCSLADLYNELLTPADLRKAHQANDNAVMQAYGLDTKMEEPDIVAHLMQLYQQLVSNA